MFEQSAETALRLRDQAIAASSSGIVIADVRLPDMPLIYVNPAFERITGYSAAEVLGRNCRFLQGQERQQAGLTELRAALRDSRDCSVVLHNYRKDGTPFWNELNMSPVFDADGQLTHFIGVQTDITRRKLAEEGLAQARDSLEARVGERTRELSEANASLERELGKRQAAEAEIRRQVARAEALVRVAARLNAQLDLNTVVSAVCEETSRALGIAAVNVGLYDHERDTIEPAASVGLPPDARQRLAPVAKIYSDALRRGTGPFIVIADVLHPDAAPEAEYLRELGVRSFAGIRMERHGELIGALSVFQIGQPRQFTAGDLALLQGVANQAAQAIANARLLAQSESRLRRTQTLLRIDQSIAGSFELQPTLDAIVSGTIEQLAVDAVDILLLDFEAQVLTYAAGSGLQSPAILQTRRRVGEGNPGRAAQERRTVFVPNLGASERVSSRTALLVHDRFQSYYGVPLIAKGQVHGVLELFNRGGFPNTPEWLEFMGALAEQAAIAIDGARLIAELLRSNSALALAYDATLQGWSRALDLRDHETEGHSRRVTEMTVRLAQAAGLDEAQLLQVRRGALLHDIGKMGIPDNILLKPGKLTADEMAIMQRHPAYAYELLSPIAYLQPALAIPYCHHEKWDGSGYPRGLHGEQIPQAARLFAVVDVWDALRSNRPYRAAWPEARVLEHVRSLAGSHFDPRAVEAFLPLLPS